MVLGRDRWNKKGSGSTRTRVIKKSIISLGKFLVHTLSCRIGEGDRILRSILRENSRRRRDVSDSGMTVASARAGAFTPVASIHRTRHRAHVTPGLDGINSAPSKQSPFECSLNSFETSLEGLPHCYGESEGELQELVL
jgi:hypothetical protein